MAGQTTAGAPSKRWRHAQALMELRCQLSGNVCGRFSISDEDFHVVIASAVLVRIGSRPAWVVFDFATGTRRSIARYVQRIFASPAIKRRRSADGANLSDTGTTPMGDGFFLCRWFRDVSIARKLYFTVGAMALLIGIEL